MPGPQLDAIQGLDVEVRPLDLHHNRGEWRWDQMMEENGWTKGKHVANENLLMYDTWMEETEAARQQVGPPSDEIQRRPLYI